MKKSYRGNQSDANYWLGLQNNIIPAAQYTIIELLMCVIFYVQNNLSNRFRSVTSTHTQVSYTGLM